MTKTRPTITAFPLFRRRDEQSLAVFLKDQKELDLLSGPAYFLVAVKDVADLAPGDVVKAVESGRFPGLTHGEIPCVYVEGSTDGVVECFIIPLINLSEADIRNRMAVLRDRIEANLSFKQIKEKFMSAANLPPNDPRGWQRFWMNLIAAVVLLGGSGYFIATQDLKRGMLFFLFVIGPFPVAMGFLVNADKLDGLNLLDLYKSGLTALPLIGTIFKRLLGIPDGDNRPDAKGSTPKTEEPKADQPKPDAPKPDAAPEGPEDKAKGKDGA